MNWKNSARKFYFTNTFCLYEVFLSFILFFKDKKAYNHPCVPYGGLVTSSVCASAPQPVTTGIDSSPLLYTW